jgi:HK97 family phage prohead protease
MNARMRAVVEAERHLAGASLPRTARLSDAEMLATAERCERERLAGSPAPLSSDLATNGQEITGIASAHGSVAFGERGPTMFAPKAFDEALARSTAYPLLWQHIDSLPIGTAHLGMTPAGLHLRGVVADSTQGRDALAVARVGGLSGISIGFIPHDVTKTKHPVRATITTSARSRRTPATQASGSSLRRARTEPARRR